MVDLVDKDSYGWGGGGRTQVNWTQNAVQEAVSDGAPASDEGPVSLGRVAVRAEVNASFSLESP